MRKRGQGNQDISLFDNVSTDFCHLFAGTPRLFFGCEPRFDIDDPVICHYDLWYLYWLWNQGFQTLDRTGKRDFHVHGLPFPCPGIPCAAGHAIEALITDSRGRLSRAAITKAAS